MKQYQLQSSERGSAILLVLGILTVVMTLAMVFAITSRNEATIAKATAENGRMDLFAESTTARTMSLLYYLGRDKDGKPEKSFTHLATTAGVYKTNLLMKGRITNSNKRYYRADGTEAEYEYPAADYQEVFYTASNTSDTAAANSDIVSAIESTPYGSFYVNNSDFKSALQNLNFIDVKQNYIAHSDNTTALPDDIYRWAFLAINDTSKFNINDLVNYKETGYVPAIAENGKFRTFAGTSLDTTDTSKLTEDKSMITDWSNPGKDLYDVVADAVYGKIANIFPILGYVDPANPTIDDAVMDKADESKTLRYGIHPQELVVPTEYRDIFGEPPNNTPYVFSQDLLVSNKTLKEDDSSSNKKIAAKRYYMLYSVISGKDDREEVYTTSGGTTETGKVNIQYPGFDKDAYATSPAKIKSWDDISKMYRDGTATLKDVATTEPLNALNALKFNGDDSSTDVTAAVLTNLIDFCDSDNLITHNFTFNGNRVKFDDTDFDSDSNVDKKFEPAEDAVLCGNEKVPAVTSVAIKATLKSDITVENTTITPLRLDVIGPPIETTPMVTNVWSMTGSKPPTLALSISATLDNIFEEDLPCSPKIKFVVKGRYCVYYRGEYPMPSDGDNVGLDWNAGLPSTVPAFPEGNYIFSQKYDGEDDPSNRYVNWCEKAKASLDANDGIWGNDTGNLKTLVNGNAIDFVWESDAVSVDDNVKKALTRVQIDFSDSKEVTTYGSNKDVVSSVSRGIGHITGIGVYMAIDEVVAIVADSANSDDDTKEELIDFAWYNAEQDSKNIYDEHELRSHDEDDNTGENIQNFLNSDNDDSDKYALIGWMTTVDPRLNHRWSAWRWHNSSVKDNSSETAGTGSTLTTGESFRKESDRSADLANTQECIDDDITETTKHYVNNNSNVDVETSLNLDGKGSGDTETYSTAFIPNHPIANFWQLGAVHRGEACRTINLTKYGTDGGNTYASGDGWILDRIKLSAISKTTPIFGRFNPNCLNENSFRYLFEGLPSENGTFAYEQYANDSAAKHYTEPDTAFPDWLNNNKPKEIFTTPSVNGDDCDIDWLPVKTMYNWLQAKADITVTAPNDREAEKIFACTAGLLSTRYETFSVFTVSQSLKYIATADFVENIDTESVPSKNTFLKQFANPEKLKISLTDDAGATTETEVWYEKKGLQVRLLTIIRDCWTNKFEIVRSQKYE